MKNEINARWITTTAVFVALLIAVQAFTAPFGQYVTGSLVNLILITSVMTCGLASGVTVATISPVLAKLIGIGPFWAIVPFILAGNIVLVIIWHYIGNKKWINVYFSRVITIIAAAAGKCALLYIGVVLILIPYVLLLPEPQATVVAGLFSINQLFTAAIGGTVATIILPVIEKARGARSKK